MYKRASREWPELEGGYETYMHVWHENETYNSDLITLDNVFLCFSLYALHLTERHKLRAFL